MTNTTLREWNEFRRARGAALRSPDGWLTPVALGWVTDAPTAVEGLPGRWQATGGVGDDGAGVTVDLGDEETLNIDGDILTGPATAALSPGSKVGHDGRRIEILLRGDAWALRIWDPQSPLRLGFDEIDVFDHDPSWILRGEFVPAADGQTEVLGSVAEGISHRRRVLGWVHISKDGAEQVLTVTRASHGPEILFRDATSGRESASSLRVVRLPSDPAPGALSIDFNRAENLPCAYTEYCTCPLPPTGNTLELAVRAGERAPAVDRWLAAGGGSR